MASTSIVVINASTSLAPAPITLQEMGAMISQGATNLASGASALLTSNNLSSLLAPPLALTSLVWSGSTVLATTAAAIAGLTAGDVFITTIAGVTPSGYNGLYKATVTGANTFTYTLAANPGNETVPGTYTPGNQSELVAMVNTFFGQGSGQSVSVLELGAGDGTTGPAALGTWITANPNTFYSYLVPYIWDATAAYLALIAQYGNPTSKTYFFTTTTLSTYASYPANKSVIALIQAPGKPLTEYTAAALFQITLNYAPSSTNRQTPLCYSFVYGATAWQQMGNNATLTALKAANINVIIPAAEGGLSDNMVAYGRTLDGNDFTWWYAADWLQLQSDRSLSAAVINGSNNPLNPLYYDQPGVNTLQDVEYQVLSNGISYGLLTGTVARAALDGPAFQVQLDAGAYEDQDVVNAVPFITYTTENESNYQEGIYGGLQVVAIPNRGFTQIILNLNVSNLISS
jgi:hypothetical protein